MDLKFTFNGGDQNDANPGHTHDGVEVPSPTGIPLPFSTAPASTSSVLDVHVRREGDDIVAEAISGDGVTYARAQVPSGTALTSDATGAIRTSSDVDGGVTALASSVRSAISRAVAELEGPLSEAVTGIRIALGTAGSEIAAILFPERSAPDQTTDAAFQRRTGVNAGTPIIIEGGA